MNGERRRRLEDEQIDSILDEVTFEQWARLAAVGEQLGSSEGAAGRWAAATRDSDGTWTFGCFVASPALGELVELLYDAGLISGVFDWPEWWQASAYCDGRGVIDADERDLVRILTSVVRGDRFSEGTLAEYVRNGTVPTAVLQLSARRGRAI